MAKAVAVMSVAVAVVFAYWAAGGSFGLSGSQPHPSFELQASRVAGAMIAVVGLLALAGRWGHHTRFWLPAALAWIGSGALVAFDGLNLVLTQLFAVSGTNTSETGWSLFDTVLVIKVVIGVLAAAVGVVAIRAVAADNRTRPAGGDVTTTAGSNQPKRRSTAPCVMPVTDPDEPQDPTTCAPPCEAAKR